MGDHIALTHRRSLPKAHKPVVGRVHEFTWRLKRHWSCPVHDGPVSHPPIWDEEWNDGSTICLDCVMGAWVITKDEDGWAELIFTEKTTLDRIMADMKETLREELNRTTYLTREL